ncbi:MAG: polynucleotide kinase-phosphatase [Sedimentisphaerales bacterium]|nr:polynucleotide kinase-phosphatase [Sedimentisphaerales bacterium]
MEISIPKLSLVVLIGPSGSGKSTFARKHFLPTEVLSSDICRGWVSDEENNQEATNDAFEILHAVASKRLAAGRLTVVDATNVQPDARKPLVALARAYHCLPVAIVFDLPEKLCQERNRERADRNFGPHVIRQQRSQLRRGLRGLRREGFRHIFIFNEPEQIESATIERVSLWNDKREEHGPFDMIGDVHGCCDELEALFKELGYEPVTLEQNDNVWGNQSYRHPEGRQAVFLGDLVDRGPRILDTLRLVRNMVTSGAALCVPGNHDMKFMRKLMGKDVQITHGLAESLAECEALAPELRKPTEEAIRDFLDGLVSHYVLDDGRLVVAHAGMPQEMQGRGSGKVRDFALYGETTGETDEFGLPVRFNWAADYRGPALVVYGHTPVPQPDWLNRTVNIDTGCIYGGSLTALRYPEKEFVSVPAARIYCESKKPFLAMDGQGLGLSAQQQYDDVLDAEDVIGKRIVTTRLRGSVTIRPENAAAALEVMSRFAANPKWLIYLPPTMSPCETSEMEGFLEHPTEAFGHYRSVGMPQVICQQKHMGSRAVVIVCRDATAAKRRFGIEQPETGIVYTRTGRRFFDDSVLEEAFLARVRGAFDKAGFWDRFETDWVCLDCELMPWSVKAQELLKQQYGAVGAAGRAALPDVAAALKQASEQSSAHPEFQQKILLLQETFSRQLENIEKFVAAYRVYCWSVNSLDDLKLAPFHIMATEGKVHVDQDHLWHMQTLAELCGHDELLLATPFLTVDVTGPASLEKGIAWWRELTDAGGEGMVVKPLPFVAKGKRGLVQPAIKCRGLEYLRIIYGPDYTDARHLERLRNRSLAAKRSLALREFSLGIEALERFCRQEPLRRVHECVFGVLAMESEPVDPRL